VASGVGDRGQQRRHGGQDHSARGGNDHESDGPQQGGLQALAEDKGQEEHQQSRRDDADGVALFDLFNEQLGLRLGRGGFLHEGHDATDHRVLGSLGYPDRENAAAVDGSGEHLVAFAPNDRNRFPGHRRLIDLADPPDDDTVGADPFTRAHQNHVADLQVSGVDLLFEAGPVEETGGTFRGQAQQGTDGVSCPLRDQGFQGTRCCEDDDQQGPVENLADGRGRDRRDDHQQVHVQGLLAQRPQTRQGRFPAAGRVAGQIERPPHDRRCPGQLRGPADQEKRQSNRGPPDFGQPGPGTEN